MDRGDSVKVKFRKLDEKATTPERGSQYAAGWDLVATSMRKEKGVLTYGTSLGIEIPEGYFGILAARNSIYCTDLGLTNGLGIIGSNHSGELLFKYRVLYEGECPKVYSVGDRVGQLIILSHAAPEWVEADVIDNKE